MNGEQNFLLSVLPLTLGIYPGGAHEIHTTIQRIKEKTHIFH